MAISVDWAAKLITIPKSDLTLVSGTSYSYDVLAFYRELMSLADDDEGMPWPTPASHNTSVQVGTLTLAHVVQIINGYSVVFEDGQYGVDLTGANHNLLDVLVRNQVSVATQNSAGLIETATSGLTTSESTKLTEMHTWAKLTKEQAEGEHTTDPVAGKVIIRNTTVQRRWEANAWEDAAKTQPYRGQGLEAVDDLVEVAWS